MSGEIRPADRERHARLARQVLGLSEEQVEELRSKGVYVGLDIAGSVIGGNQWAMGGATERIREKALAILAGADPLAS